MKMIMTTMMMMMMVTMMMMRMTTMMMMLTEMEKRHEHAINVCVQSFWVKYIKKFTQFLFKLCNVAIWGFWGGSYSI